MRLNKQVLFTVFPPSQPGLQVLNDSDQWHVLRNYTKLAIILKLSLFSISAMTQISQ